MTLKKKAQVSIYIAFVVLSLTIIVLGAVFAPMGADFSIQFYSAGADILRASNASIAKIQDQAVKDQFYEVVGNALESQEQNVTITTGMYQYSWIFVLLLAGLTLFIFTRRVVEFSGGGIV
jgi:predicted PurR-regulated permease PerM